MHYSSRLDCPPAAAPYRGPQWSYDRHRVHEREHMEEDYPSCYSNPQSVDAWRHRRMYEHVLPLLECFPQAEWMTVGDGKYGSDAYFLSQHGADVLATSLCDELLAVAQRSGFIDKYRAENAERLSAADDSCDFVLCKAAYHHFPRPAVALYEMLRVARRAVVLIEPQETFPRPLDHARTIVKRVLRGDRAVLFEESGNFIFRVNVREVEKMMTALNYGALAVRRFNDFYHPRLSKADYLPWSFPTLATRLGIKVQDLLCAARLLDYGSLCLVAFKEVPSMAVRQSHVRHGFRVRCLPKNPYLESPEGSQRGE